jgi:ABC-type amino acid transport substrate-binding protein
MAKLRVTIIDEVRDRRLKVDLPDDAAIEKLLPALAKKLGLPLVAYQLTHEATGRALGGDQTLASFGVKEGDALRLAEAREEAPSVPRLDEEEAIPIWQKVPVWAWVGIGGVVLLIAVAGAFLAGRGARPEPTVTVVAEVATPTATAAAMPQPTATPVAPTFTPLPPTDTPVPTSTPRPKATPVSPTDTPMPPTDTPVPTPAKPTTTLAPGQLESERAAQITARGTIRVGVHESPGLWPLSIWQGDSCSGFEIDLAQEIVKWLFDGKVSIEWVLLTAAERLQALESGQIDFLIRNTTHTRSREEFGLWTSNYFLDGSRLLVRQNEGYTGIEDLSGGSVSVVAGTKWETDLYEAADAIGVQITTVSFEDYDAAFAAFTEGRTDAFIYDWSVLLALSQGDPVYQVVGEILSSESLGTSEPLAIGIPPNNPDFRNEVDGALQEIIADGTWQMFYDRWFPDPPPWTLEEMLAEPPPNR